MKSKITLNFVSIFIFINFIITFFSFSLCFAEPSTSEQETVSNVDNAIEDLKKSKNMLGFEGLGRGFLYSMYYERVINSQTSLGSGIVFLNKSYAMPIYANLCQFFYEQ